jgi:hypothetical protein
VTRIDQLLGRAMSMADCVVRPPVDAAPRLHDGLSLPADLQEFYKKCGSVVLYVHSPYSVEILPLNEIRPINEVILGEEFPDDRSYRWVTLAGLPNADFVSIDLDADRLGCCYDSSQEVHGVIGSCAIVARSFADFFEAALNAEGGYWYWLEEGFASLGDAYD